MNTLPIRIVDTSKQAPNYNGGDFKGAKLTEALIVKRGTVAGKPTVDLVFEVRNKDGVTTDIAVAMVTGSILEMLAGAIAGCKN